MGEVRWTNPKAENRKPKTEPSPKIEIQKSPATDSRFEFRISFGPRISAFGFLFL